MEIEAILTSPGPYHSQQFYHSCLLWFKIITLTILTDTGEGPNIRREKVASKAAPLYHKLSGTFIPQTEFCKTTNKLKIW
jgi:hypothetical protein